MTLLLLLQAPAFGDADVQGEEQSAIQSKFQCIHQIPQFYGLEGLPESHPPSRKDQDGALRSCPGIEHSCCSRDDFIQSQRLWEEQVLVVKGYLTKIFRIIQKLIMVQSSLVEVAQQASSLEHDQCKLIDVTFFNPPVPFNEVYSYLMVAFQSMAYIQKGFYCTICDAKNHPFMVIKKDVTSVYVQISQKSCNDLIYRFKEFLMYKTYYFDSFLTNAAQVFNCVEGTEQYNFNSSYVSQYQEIRNCVESGHNCDIVCNEFRLGGFSDLFMGDIAKFEAFHADFMHIAKLLKIDIEAITDEVFIPDYSFDSNDFFVPKTDRSALDNSELAYFQLSKMEIMVKPDGIDLFGTAEDSNYFLMSQYSNLEKSRIFNGFGDNSDADSLLGKGIQNTPMEEAHNAKLAADGLTEAQNGEGVNALMEEEDLQKLNDLPGDLRPTENQLETMENQIVRDERERDQFRQKNGKLEDYDPRDDNPANNDFSGFDGTPKSSPILSSVFVLAVLFNCFLK